MATASFAGRRPRTAAPEVRRRQLIEATIESIALHGLSGTTMATVTGLADLSMGLVGFHFRTKENLLQETLVYLAEEHRARWVESLADTALAPEAKLAAIVDAHFHPTTCDDKRVAVWFAFFGDARYREIYRRTVAGFDTERTAMLTELCERLIERGDRNGIDAEEVACNIEALADGLWLSVMLYPHWLDRDSAKLQVERYLAAVFPEAFATWPSVAAAAGGLAGRRP